jgi:hypothetical protein
MPGTALSTHRYRSFRLGPALALAACFVAACAARPYVPQEYPIDKGRIPEFDVAGSVTVGSLPTDPAWKGPSGTFQINFKLMSETFRDQLAGEIGKNGKKLGGAEAKLIEVSVDSLKGLTNYNPLSQFTSGEVGVTVRLANGRIVRKKVRNTVWESMSTQGTCERLWNGAIAEAVVEVLKDSEVLKYLAYPGAPRASGLDPTPKD